MKLVMRVTLLTLLAVISGCAWFKPGARIPALDEKYRPAAQYKAGESREAWSAIAKEVRESQSDEAKRRTLRRQLAALIASRPTPDAAQMACRQLAIIGTAEEVPALAALLGDSEYADEIRYALENIPGPEASEALRDALVASEGNHRVGIINSLGARRDAKSVSALRKLALSRDDAVRSASIHSLGLIGGEKAIKALRRLPESDGEEVAAALLDCGDAYVAAGDKAKAAVLYDEILNSELSTPTKNSALHGWLVAKGTEGIPRLMEAMQSNDEKVAAAAARLARDMPGGFPATLALAEAVPTLKPPGQIRLMRALADRGDVSALAPISKAALSHDKSIRMAAYEALGSLGDATVVTMMVHATGTAEADEAEVARSALRAMRDEHVDQALLRLLESMDEPTRIEIVNILAARRASGAATDLIRITEDPSAKVRAAAWKAVGMNAGAGDLSHVLNHLKRESDANARIQGVNAAAAVVARNPDREAAAREVVKALDEAGHSPALMAVLGRTRGDLALDRLTRALKDPAWAADAGVIVDALCEWDNEKPAAALLEFAKSKGGDMYRGTALGGYVRLTALYSQASDAEKARLASAALALAHSNEERRAMIFHLRDLKSLEGLKLTAPYLEKDDADLRELAAESVLQISSAISGAHPNESKAALGRIAEGVRSEALAKKAGHAIARIEAMEDFLAAWEVSGPHRERNMTANQAFARVFPPEIPSAAKDVQWKPISIGTNADKPWLIDLQEAIGGGDRAAYLRTQIWSPKAQPATLELGSDDGVKAWLNGALIHENNASRGAEPAQDKVQIELKEGWNPLMLKIVNGGADWGACARIRARDGSKLTGLKFKTGS